MAVTAGELYEFLGDFDADDLVYIDDGGLAIVINESSFEIGGAPIEDECPHCGATGDDSHDRYCPNSSDSVSVMEVA